MNLPKYQTGFTVVIFLIGVLSASAALIGGSFYLKANYPSLVSKLSSSSSLHNMTAKPQAQVTQPKTDPTPTPQLLPRGLDPKFVLAQNIFSFKIFQEILKTDSSRNIFISPTGISLALSIVYQGALDQTKDTMAKTLEIHEMSKDDLNTNNQDLLNILQTTDPKVEISVANSIFGKSGLKFNQEFINTNQQYYQAKFDTLDFSAPNAAAVINTWVKNNTKNKITQIVTSPLPKNTVMYLLDAVYFKGAWSKEFDKNLTNDRDFILANKSKKKYPMMEQKGNFKYLENDEFQAISLPYGQESRFGMYLFLPKKDLKQLTSTMNAQNWSKWMEEFAETEGTIILPKLKVEYEKELKGPLGNLGMGVAFSDKANFENLAPKTYLSAVKHKTYLEVDEQGTEASAVTSAEMKTTSVKAEDKTFYMKVDKPFFFAIRDNRLETILFMGIIQDPKSN